MSPAQTDLQPPKGLDGTSARGGLRRRRRRQLNPRQRQGMLLVAVAAAGLVGVFVLIAGYVRNVSTQVGPKIEVLELKSTLQPYQLVSPAMLDFVSVPQKWAPQNALRTEGQAVGLISDVALQPGTRLQSGMLTQPPTLQGGQEEMAVYVDAETGVAGQIVPGSLVSIVATYQGNSQGVKSSARVVVPVAKVLGVGTPTTAGGSASGSSQPTTQSQVVPVTFALTPDQVLAVSYAESFAQKVRLALMAPGAQPPVPPPPYKPGL